MNKKPFFAKRKIAIATLIIVLGLFLTLISTHVRAESLLFLSTQLTPFDEAEKMRSVILKDFPVEVDFQPNDNRLIFTQLATESFRGSNRPGLLGGLHGDLSILAKAGALESVSDILPRLKGRKFVKSFVRLGKLGREGQYYIPWMQATYIMAANRRALKYLPKGANLDSLTYDQLKAWAANMKSATGEAKLGFPVGPKGLMHRFLQGYLYPSYTGSTLRKFACSEAVTMWREFRDLWQYVNPLSLTFSHMDEQLISGEVWVAWDHSARVLEAFKQHPDEFVAFPAPAGPKGRGFMVVLAGLGIPKDAPGRKISIDLIDYLTRIEVQVATLKSVGFFPVVLSSGTKEFPPHLALISDAVKKQASAGDAIPTLLPVGLGEKSRAFNTVYRLAFSRILLRGQNIRSVLEDQARKMRHIVSETGVQCWPPDEPSTGPCPVED